MSCGRGAAEHGHDWHFLSGGCGRGIVWVSCSIRDWWTLNADPSGMFWAANAGEVLS